MRLYPDLPGARARAIAADVLVLLLLAGCLAAGLLVHGAISQLDVLGRGVQRAGTQVQDGFRGAGSAVDGAPVIGDDLERALSRAGSATAEPVIQAGGRGRAAVSDLARLLGLVTGGIPALGLLLAYAPRRMARARRVRAARRVFAHATTPGQQRLLAMRAAFALPLSTLLRHTRDPLGDLEAGRLEPLLAAIGDEYGVRVPASGTRHGTY